jgi:hypothetical protein
MIARLDIALIVWQGLARYIGSVRFLFFPAAVVLSEQAANVIERNSYVRTRPVAFMYR